MSRRERLLNQLLIAPRSPEIDERKKRFDELNAFVSARGDAWLVSVPGAHELRLDALVGSPIPNDLRALGYIVEKIGTSERTLAQAGGPTTVGGRAQCRPAYAD
jgi:hypothetical protein